MRQPRTSAGRAIVARLQDHAEDMARRADEPDLPSYLRSMYQAKAETYRLACGWLPRLLAEAEDEAVDIEANENARIDNILEAV